MILAGSALAQTPAVSLRIETASGRRQFKMGEAIGLKLTFDNASADTWNVSGVQGGGRSVLGFEDRFLVSPKEGTTDPRAFLLGQPMIIEYLGQGGTRVGSEPVAMNVDLNDWVRFDRPGWYRVSALLHAGAGLQPEVAVNSNEIELDIVPASEEWRAEQLRQAVAALEAPAGRDQQAVGARESATRALGYLDTRESLREAARLLGTADAETVERLRSVLEDSPDQAGAIAAMNQSLRSPDQAVTPIFINTFALMTARQQFPFPGDPGAGDPDGEKRIEAVGVDEKQLRSELAAVIAEKRGKAKAISLDTVLGGLRSGSVTDDQRAQLAAVFMELPREQQNEVLGWQWNTIAGPAMIPVLRQIYENLSKDPENSLAPAAVQRLYELDPAGTRPLILNEIKRETPRLPPATLAILDDATLPGMDRVLLGNLQHGAWQDDGVAELIARYATADILDGVKAWYEKQNATRRMRASRDISDVAPDSCQPALIGYFLRVDPAWGERALRGVLNDREAFPRSECWTGIVGKTAKYNAGPAWEKVAIEALADTVAGVFADPVEALGEYGSAAAQQAVMDAFLAWHDRWKDRPAELVSEGPFEQIFFQALVRGRNWIANGEELEKIRGLCITAGCQSEAEEYIGAWRDAVPVSIAESNGGDVNVSFAQYLAMPLDAARVRLLQLPAGTRLKWQRDSLTLEIDAWITAMDSDLAARGVVITP